MVLHDHLSIFVWLPPTTKLTLILTQTPTLTGGEFSSGGNTHRVTSSDNEWYNEPRNDNE